MWVKNLTSLNINTIADANINSNIDIIDTRDTIYLYSMLVGGGARDRGMGLKTQFAGFGSEFPVPCSLQLK